ncbi:MAG: S41 family peptidase [Acidaminobacteraceae bacterium]
MKKIKRKYPAQKFRKKIITLLMVVILLASSSISFSQDVFVNAENMTGDDYLNYMLDVIKSNYKYDITEEQLYNGIYKGLFDSLDKHSSYFEPSDYKEFNVNVSGEFGGIGITIELNESGYLTIVSPIKNTPGQRAGLSTGDVIKAVNGVDIKDWPLEKTLAIMRGKPETEIILGVQKFGEEKITNIKIIREIIKLNAVDSKITDDKIGVLTISSFNQSVSSNVLLALNEFKEKKIKGLVIDLRNNPGGSLSEVLKISDLFVEAGKELLYVDVKGDGDQSFTSAISPVLEKMPIMVLINGSSASASEILAGVLQDYDLATIIGSNSYGKGTVQNIYDLPNGSGMKMTIAEYLTPSHNKIDGVGIKPDIEVNDENPLLKSKKDEIAKFVPMIEEREYRYLGETGLNIYGAQQRLSALGYDVSADGILGKGTIAVIKKFQFDYNLRSDGVLGLKTIKVLENSFTSTSKVADPVLNKAFEIIRKSK